MLLHIRWDRDNSGDDCAKDQYGSDPEVPPKTDVLSNQASKEDANKEAERGPASVPTESKICPWARPLQASQQHNACWQERRWPKTLECSTAVQHEFIARETCNEGPQAEPGQSSEVYRVSTIYICKPPEWKEEGCCNESKGTAGPNLGGRGDV